jgi:hypothetical protein
MRICQAYSSAAIYLYICACNEQVTRQPFADVYLISPVDCTCRYKTRRSAIKTKRAQLLPHWQAREFKKGKAVFIGGREWRNMHIEFRWGSLFESDQLGKQGRDGKVPLK